MGEGQEVDFLTEIEGKMVCGKSFIFPMIGGSGLSLSPFCWVPWQELDSLLLDK